MGTYTFPVNQSDIVSIGPWEIGVNVKRIARNVTIPRSNMSSATLNINVIDVSPSTRVKYFINNNLILDRWLEFGGQVEPTSVNIMSYLVEGPNKFEAEITIPVIHIFLYGATFVTSAVVVYTVDPPTPPGTTDWIKIVTKIVIVVGVVTGLAIAGYLGVRMYEASRRR